MKKYFDKVSNDYSILRKIMDSFYRSNPPDFSNQYWNNQVPKKAQNEILENFDTITSKDINKIDYKNSGLDEFEYYLTLFLANLSENYPELDKDFTF